VSGVNTLLNIPIILTVGHPEFRRHYTPAGDHSHLLIAPNSSSLTQYLEGHKKEYPQSTWRPKESFLFLISFNETDTTSDHHNIFDHLWNERRILKVLVVIKSLAKTGTDYALAYDPFLVDEVSRKARMWIVQPEKLHELPLTCLQRTSNLHGYTLNISMFNDPPTAVVECDNVTGKWINKRRDGQVLDIIAKYMNFTPAITPPEDNKRLGYKMENGTFTGALADLINRRTDISVNEIYLKYYGTDEIEFTTPAIRVQEVVILVPKSTRSRIWMVIYKALRRLHWQYVLTSFFSCVVVWYLLRRVDARRQIERRHEISFFKNALEMLAIFMNMPLSFLIRTKSSPQRVLLSSCLIFSLFAMCNFQGLLLDIVTNPHFDMDIDTIQQLDEAGLFIWTQNPNLFDTFNGSETMEHLRDKLSYREDYLSVISRMKKYKNVSLLCSKKRARWILRHHGNEMLHIVAEAPRTYLMSYLVPKDSPYLPRLRVLFGRITQAGLVDKWDDDHNYEMRLQSQLHDTELEVDQWRLKMSDVAVNFIFLTVGLVVCVFVFLIELSSYFIVRNVCNSGSSYLRQVLKW
jgi:hypothetical protein